MPKVGKLKTNVSAMNPCTLKKILFVGDTVPNGPFSLGNSLKELCSKHDLCVFNLEGAFSKKQKPILKAGPHLLLNENCFVPVAESFNVAILANNHSMDFGKEGLQYTLRLCQQNGVVTVGAGMNFQEAFTPLDMDNIRIIAIAENKFGAADYNQAGIATVDNPLKIHSMIRDGHETGKFVAIVAHGGTETIPIPPPYLRERYKLWIEYGADLVIGNHPHVVQGYELHNGKSIFYSLGNFAFFDDSFKKYPNADWSISVSVDISNNQVRVIPVLPNINRTIDLSLDRNYAEEFERLSAMITSPDYKSIYEHIAAEKYSSWYPRLATKSPQDAALLLHYFRCDAHRNMVQTALSQAIGELQIGRENDNGSVVTDHEEDRLVPEIEPVRQLCEIETHPEDISKINLGRDDENWFTHENTFRNLLRDHIGRSNLLFLELGSWKGRSALWLAENILTGEDSRLVCVDVWDVNQWDPQSSETQQLLSNPRRMRELKIETLYDSFINNTAHLKHIIAPMRTRTVDALRNFIASDIKFDFIYIDADHSEKAVYEDFRLSYECLKSSGIIFFDDLSWASVQKAIKRISADFGISIEKADQNGAYYIHRNASQDQKAA